MSRPRRRPRPGIARYAAPAAFLLAVTVAVLLVRAGLQGGDTQTTTQTPTRQSPTSATSTTSTQRPHARYYRVVAGDTFGSISARVGISIARLQQLNPGVDSGALQVGQRLRVK